MKSFRLSGSYGDPIAARQIFDKMRKIYMVDVKIPTTDGREIVIQRYGEPKNDVAVVLSQLGLRLPPQPRRRSTARQLRRPGSDVVEKRKRN